MGIIMALKSKFDFLAIGFTRPIFSLFAVYIAYLLFGSLCFVLLEAHHEEEVINKTTQTVQLTQDMVRWLRNANFSDDSIKRAFLLEHELEDEMYRKKKGIFETSWYHIYGEKVFFAFVLITTIGYGNVTQKTAWGQLITIIYTLFGLPIHAIMMRLLSVKFREGLRCLFSYALELFSEASLKRKKRLTISSPCLQKFLLITFAFLFFLLWTVILILIPSYILMFKEGWTYNQAFYFTFMSLTTIGLGDYVARVPEKNSGAAECALTVILVIVWMFFGLGFVAMSVNMLSYVMGIYTLDKFDCKCRERTEAMKKLKPLLDLMKELNWQLVKGKPDGFDQWEEIEEFKDILAENPQDVDSEMLKKMFYVVRHLRECAFEQTARMKLAIPSTSFLRRARQRLLPDILSAESVTLSQEIQTIRQKGRESHRILPISKSDEVISSEISEGAPPNSASHEQFSHRGPFSEDSSQGSSGSSRKSFETTNLRIFEDRSLDDVNENDRKS